MARRLRLGAEGELDIRFIVGGDSAEVSKKVPFAFLTFHDVEALLEQAVQTKAAPLGQGASPLILSGGQP